MNAGKGEKKPGLSEFVAAAGFALGIVSAWLYLTGWTYAYHYFDRFAVPLMMVDISKENYFVYGGIVVQQFPIRAAFTGIVLLVIVHYGSGIAAKLGRLTTPVLVFGVIATFWLGHQVAIAAAHEQYRNQRESDYSAYPRVQVWIKETKTQTDGSALSSKFIDGCYRLLLHNQNRLFLLRPIKDAPSADLPVAIVPWETVELVRVLPDYSSCK